MATLRDGFSSRLYSGVGVHDERLVAAEKDPNGVFAQVQDASPHATGELVWRRHVQRPDRMRSGLSLWSLIGRVSGRGRC